MQENVQRLDPSSLFRDKLLLGLNLYGYEYSTKSREAFIGHRYLEILKGTSPKFEYKAEEVEHAVHFTDSKSGDNRVAYYPTLYVSLLSQIPIYVKLLMFHSLSMSASLSLKNLERHWVSGISDKG